MSRKLTRRFSEIFKECYIKKSILQSGRIVDEITSPAVLIEPLKVFNFDESVGIDFERA